MKTIKLLKWCILALMMCNISYAQPAAAKDRPTMMNDGMKKELKLVHAQIALLQAQNMTLLSADLPDKNKLYANIDKIADYQKQVHKKMKEAKKDRINREPRMRYPMDSQKNEEQKKDCGKREMRYKTQEGKKSSFNISALTEEQKKKLKSIKLQFLKKQTQLRNQMRELRAQMKINALQQKDNASLESKMFQNRTQIHKNLVDKIISMKQVLNDDQKIQLNAMLERMMMKTDHRK